MNLISKKWKKINNKNISIVYSDKLIIKNKTNKYGAIIYPKIFFFNKKRINHVIFFGQSDSEINLKIITPLKEKIIPLNTAVKVDCSGFYLIMIAIPPNSDTAIDLAEYYSYNYELEKISNTIDKLDHKVEKLMLENDYYRTEINSIINSIHSKVNSFNFELLPTNSNKHKILIVGFYGGYNLGDELMLQTLLGYLEKINNLEITVMLAENDNYKIDDYKNIRFIHYLKSKYDYVKVSDYYDSIIFGGGALIDDNNFSEEEITLSKILINLTLKFIYNNKKAYWIGLSSNKKLQNSNFVDKLNFIVKNIEYISFRDSNSIKTLQFSGIDTSKIELINDIIYSNNIITTKKKKNTKKRKIGIIYICDKTKTYPKILDITKKLLEYLTTKNYDNFEINLIPFYNYQENDKKILNDLKMEIKSNVVKVADYTNDFNEIIDIINEQDFLITMRYHALLISSILQKNILTIVYDEHHHYENKILYVYEQQNINKNQIYFSNYTNEELNDAFNNLFNNINKNTINYDMLFDSQKQLEKILKLIKKNMVEE